MATDILFLGDDFTGASDSLANYARHGWRTKMVLNPLAGLALDGLDALGLPTDLRALAPQKAVAEIARLWPTIEAASPRILHLKVCSTFDSSPKIGSIGAVASELMSRFKPDIVAIIGGQPSLGRYCAFGTLFARGPDGAVHRIDRHPVMSRHPVTPMSEADLRVHLQAQGLADLQLMSFPELDDSETIQKALRDGPVLFDVTSTRDQERIAEALRRVGGRQLLIGATSVAEILVQGRSQPIKAAATTPPTSQNCLLFAGSRSATTQAQIDASTASVKLTLTPEALRSGHLRDEATARLRNGVPVLVHLDPDADYGLSADALADASSAFVAGILDSTDVGYLGIAGGDTSSRICAELGFDTLEFQTSLGAGVCICTAAHKAPRRDAMRVMLKGGQMGTPGLFDQFTTWANAELG